MSQPTTRPLCPHCFRDACPWLAQYRTCAVGETVDNDNCPTYNAPLPPNSRKRLEAALARREVVSTKPKRTAAEMLKEAGVKIFDNAEYVTFTDTKTTEITWYPWPDHASGRVMWSSSPSAVSIPTQQLYEYLLGVGHTRGAVISIRFYTPECLGGSWYMGHH